MNPGHKYQRKSYAMRRMARLRANIEATMENLRLGAIKGIVYDADGTVIGDSEFGGCFRGSQGTGSMEQL